MKPDTQPAKWKTKIFVRMICPFCGWNRVGTLFYIKTILRKQELYVYCPRCHKRVPKWKVQVAVNPRYPFLTSKIKYT